jgi:hypothetical protein
MVGIYLAGVLLVVGLGAVVASILTSGRPDPGDEPSPRPVRGAGALPGPRSVDDPRVTRETFEGLHADLPLDMLEELLGPGRKVSFEELPLADRPTRGREDRAKLRELAQKYRVRSWYLWSGKGRWAFAGFRTQESSIVAWHFRGPGGEEAGALDDSENTLP